MAKETKFTSIVYRNYKGTVKERRNEGTIKFIMAN